MTPRRVGAAETDDQLPVRTLLFVALGGAAGTSLRYAFGRLAPVGAHTFPTTTLTVNVAGAFALGLLLGTIARAWPGDTTFRPLIGIGLLGGFTTFSTFAVEAVQLVRGDDPLLAASYVVASMTLGLLAAAVGIRLANSRPAAITEGES